MKNFCYDIETLDKESTAIVLSAAIVYFDLTEQVDYDTLLDRTKYIKFKVSTQKAMGRTVSKSTLDWWFQQDDDIRRSIVLPSPIDVCPKEGIEELIYYVQNHGDDDSMMWTRGNLDQLVTESLCNSLGYPKGADHIIHYNRWMDIRTFIRLTKDTADRRGYCTIPDFDSKTRVKKHDPIHDVCYDVLQIIHGV